ncbi:hypothetical protein Moror_9442 [Moniliophthora roreri MCA 2997]|uniref:Uncharacterized protein n=1 Tax=Moniliophthora roreri (strain MCA 2997) TaxID=1381753 RepID=V2WGK1_MONRO|nr:hypothetical protein Moror_9442 [Moniliophthora roreri MCA 2997]
MNFTTLILSYLVLATTGALALPTGSSNRVLVTGTSNSQIETPNVLTDNLSVQNNNKLVAKCVVCDANGNCVQC